jgi:hypothetical protein
MTPGRLRQGVLSMPHAASVPFNDLDAVLHNGSPDKHVDLLRRVTDLFLNVADRLNDEQIGAFDGVLVQPINEIEAKASAEFSTRPRHRR